ncbi:MAG: FAD-dependent oxidoreductase [Acidimicrobiales bacterium]
MKAAAPVNWRHPHHFTVVGGGLAGAALAVLLADQGHSVDLLERRAEPRGRDAGEGRSINLALSTRGFACLEAVGVADTVRSASVAMPGRMIHDVDGATHFQPYSADRQSIFSVERRHLATTLLDRADAHPNVTLTFGREVEAVDLDASVLTLSDTTGATSRFDAGIIVGADGAWSAVRSAIARRSRFDFSQHHLDHGYKELTLPAGPDGHLIEPHALHIWPRGDRMMIALPNPDGTFTVTLFWPFEGPGSFAAVSEPDQIRDVFTSTSPDLVPLIDDLVPQYLDAPTGSLVTIRCGPWWYRDKAVLIGDAAHAIVPFYGQGANAALEDALLLAWHLQRVRPNIGEAFAGFSAARKPDADALAELTLDNFVEMRDHVASPLFRARHGIEQALGQRAPGLFRPLYSMVTFSRTPYALARRRARAQRLMIDTGLATAVGAAAAVAGRLAWKTRAGRRRRSEAGHPR